MGLIVASFLGTRRQNSRPHGGTPLLSRSGTIQVSRFLALRCTNYYNVYLEFETTLGSPGASPVTLTPRGGGINPPTAGALGK